jgi:protein TonB
MRSSWWTTSSCLIGVLCSATPSLAQSVSIDTQQAPAQPEAPPQPKPPPPEPVTPPTPVSTPVEYPEGGRGEQEVILELTISGQGTVTRAVEVRGNPPFAGRAREAARSWTFRPATRGGKPIAVKIRFLVRFVPPAAEPEPEAPGAPSPPPSPAAAEPAAPPTQPQAEQVVVQ